MLALVLAIPGDIRFLARVYAFGALLAVTIAQISIVRLRILEPDLERPYRVPWNVRIGGHELPLLAIFGAVITGLGYDAVWFGILVVIVVQIGMISPPVGMNIFVVKNLLRHVSMADVFRGVTPFTFALVALLMIIVIFPGLVTWLPGFMR